LAHQKRKFLLNLNLDLYTPKGFHPPYHELAAAGLFSRNCVLHVMPDIEVGPIVELFRAEVLEMK